jgi:glycerol-3-phosphate acyltransferase PlsY
VTTLIYSIIAFLCGSIPFAVILTKFLSGKDVRLAGDNNPGAVNAWKTGGSIVGLVVMVIEFLKAILPISIAMYFLDFNGTSLIIISFMPILGHSFSPFLKFKGGKALAVTGAMWLALFQIEAAIIIFGLLAIFFAIQKNDAWTVTFVHFGLLIYGILTDLSNAYISNSEFIILWIFATLMIIFNHNKELRTPLKFRTLRDIFGVRFE